MTGGSYNHTIIAGNLYAALHKLLANKSCSVFTGDMRLWVKKRRLYTYPDIMVVCGRPKFITKWIGLPPDSILLTIIVAAAYPYPELP
jgi:Uma2 family endonuclease